VSIVAPKTRPAYNLHRLSIAALSIPRTKSSRRKLRANKISLRSDFGRIKTDARGDKVDFLEMRGFKPRWRKAAGHGTNPNVFLI
jgi:hypothetical protein